MIHFIGTSHAAIHLAEGARKRGVIVTDQANLADVIFISEDTPTDENGNRDVAPIRELVHSVTRFNKQIVLTSQVPPGFTRSLGLTNIYHQAETLRIKDAELRAENPDYIAVGGPQGVSRHYADYLLAFHCPVLRMTWEEAEFSKIAVNMTLAAQVENTNRLAAAAAKVGAKWESIALALEKDSRIGRYSYLTPGSWRNSRHLLRDAVTLAEIEKPITVAQITAEAIKILNDHMEAIRTS